MLRSYDMIQLDFLEQCQIGDQWKVREMLQSGRIDPNYHHKMNGWTGLHWAARRGHEAICLLLLEFGFSRNSKANDGKAPYDVCLPTCETVREILRPESGDEKEVEMPQASASSRQNSCESGETSPRFVPGYMKNPVFPYIGKPSNYDNVAAQGSPTTPTSPTKPGSYYSYGRRDSVNRTRFLLLRTSCCDGKEAYKRITLPGGSTVDHLHKTIEAAVKGRRVAAILTLPEKILVEEDSQIHQFTDCQKIDVIFDNEPEAPEPKGDSTPAAKNVQNGSKMENSESPVTEHESNGLENGVEENSNNSVDLSVDVEIQNEHSGDGDSSVQPEEEDEEHSVSVTFSMPTVTADATGNKNDEEARKSLDSDPGDYVKVENEDSQLSGAGDSILPADTSMLNKEEGEEKENEEKKEEEKEEKEDEKPTVVPAEPRGTVVEETKITKEKGGGVGEWMQKNPQMVVHAAVAATVISVAGLGFYIYARKFK